MLLDKGLLVLDSATREYEEANRMPLHRGFEHLQSHSKNEDGHKPDRD